MVRLRRVHTREKHLELVHVNIRILVSRYDIAIFLSIHLWSWSILCMAFFLHRHTHITFHIQFNRSIVCLTIEERCIAILLAIEVIFEREDIVWRVLIHWGICIRANHNSRIASITNHHYSDHRCNGIKPTCWYNILLYEQNDQHCDNQQDTNHCTLFDKRHTSQGHCQHKREDGAGIDSCFLVNHLVTFPYSPHECRSHEYKIDCKSSIEWAT